MIIARMVNHCDFTDTKYDPPVMGVAIIAQGATGRWCEVMWAGPEYAKEQGFEPIPYDEAFAKAEADGYADF
jgi:hypothetical protein